MEELNKLVRAIGSFIVTCIIFACPIGATLLIQANHVNFLTFALAIVFMLEFAIVLFIIYSYSEEN